MIRRQFTVKDLVISEEEDIENIQNLFQMNEYKKIIEILNSRRWSYAVLAEYIGAEKSSVYSRLKPYGHYKVRGVKPLTSIKGKKPFLDVQGKINKILIEFQAGLNNLIGSDFDAKAEYIIAINKINQIIVNSIEELSLSQLLQMKAKADQLHDLFKKEDYLKKKYNQPKFYD